MSKVEGRGPITPPPPLMASCNFFRLMPSQVKVEGQRTLNNISGTILGSLIAFTTEQQLHAGRLIDADR